MLLLPRDRRGSVENHGISDTDRILMHAMAIVQFNVSQPDDTLVCLRRRSGAAHVRGKDRVHPEQSNVTAVVT